MHYYAAVGNPKNHITLNYSIQPMTKQVQPYQQLDCVISARQLPNIAVVNETSKFIKWFAQVHHTLAIAGLELTAFS